MNISKSVRNLSKFEIVLWIGSVLLLIGVFIIFKNSDILTLTASLIGITALIFVAKGDALGQLLTVVFSVFYSVISFQFRYFGEMITYMGMTAPIAAMSMIAWIKNPYTEREVKVGNLKKRTLVVLVVLTAAVTFGFYFILQFFQTPNLLWSTVSIATSFAASSLMLLRSPYYAIAYALNDIVLIVLWVLATIQDMMYLSMVLCFIIFLINDIYGFCNWRTMKKRQQNENL